MLVLLFVHNACAFFHSIGVALIAMRFTLILGMHGVKRTYYVVNALYHDVGKVMVSNKILNKKGRLSRDEMKLVEEHTSNLVARVYGKVFPACIGHHLYGAEKYQSTVSKFVQICDVFDAVRGYFRPYAQPRTLDEIRDIMDSMQSQFDPAMYKIFRKNMYLFNSKILRFLDSLMRKEKK